MLTKLNRFLKKSNRKENNISNSHENRETINGRILLFTQYTGFKVLMTLSLKEHGYEVLHCVKKETVLDKLDEAIGIYIVDERKEKLNLVSLEILREIHPNFECISIDHNHILTNTSNRVPYSEEVNATNKFINVNDPFSQSNESNQEIEKIVEVMIKNG